MLTQRQIETIKLLPETGFNLSAAYMRVYKCKSKNIAYANASKLLNGNFDFRFALTSFVEDIENLSAELNVKRWSFYTKIVAADMRHLDQRTYDHILV